MIEIPSLRPETRYGMPSGFSQLLNNRDHVVGYSYLYRSPIFVLELITDTSQAMSDDFEQLKRLDNFRPDLRIPEMFRATLGDYRGSGFDRGHLAMSAAHRSSLINNSETFLLSGMVAQRPECNRRSWLELETRVRELAADPEVIETYCLSGPVFDVGATVEVFGDNNLSIPSSFFKCVLIERAKAHATRQIEMWAFILPNAATDGATESFQVPTSTVEELTGLQIWDRLLGEQTERQKASMNEVWWL